MTTYIIFHLIPGDPIAALLAVRGLPNYSEPIYAQMANQLGFRYSPLLGDYILRFSKFLSNYLSGAWGWSSSVIPGASVYETIFSNYTILHIILLSAIPILIGAFYMIIKSHRKSLFWNSLVVTILFSAAFVLYIIISFAFNIRGFGKLLVDAVDGNDHYLIIGCLFLLVILYILVPLTSNIIFSVYKL